MDEPLSNLDAKLRGQMRAEIRGLQRQFETTTLYVTHDQVEAMTMGDRIAVLRKGLLQQLGTPDELYETPANLFVAEFIGSPPMNVVTPPCLRTAAGHHLVVGSQRIELPAGALDRSRRSPAPTRRRRAGTAPGEPARPGRPPTPVAAPGRRRRARRERAAGEAGPPADRRRAGRHRRHRRDRRGHRRGGRRGPPPPRQGLRAERPPARHTAVREGTRAEFAVPPSALHFFDLATGQAIAPTSPRLAVASA